MTNRKRITAIISVIVLCVSLIIGGIYVQADDEIVEQYKDTELEFTAIHGIDPAHPEAWTPQGRYEENTSAANYKIYTNAYATWYTKDSFHFAYKKLDFSYGKNGTLVIESALNSWNAVSSTNAAAGVMIRSSLDSGASNVFLQVRPDYLMVTSRLNDDGSSTKGKTVNLKIQFPISLKIELKNKKAKCYIKQNGDSQYSLYTTVPFLSGSSVYAGLAAYSQCETETALADFTGYNAYVSVPAGTKPSTPGESGSSTVSSEESITIPADPEVEPNVLMRETFTSGALNHEKENYPNEVNWLFDENNAPTIITNNDLTNRYLNFDSTTDGMYVLGGDQHWADYTAEVELTFTNEWTDTGKNEVYVFVRHTDITQYGVHGYAVCFKKSNNGTIICIGRRNGGKYTVSPTQITNKGAEGDILSANFNYLPGLYDEPITVKLKIKAFDNVITVWLNDDDTPVLRYTDTTDNVNGFGNIGVMCNSAAVNVDNIIVTEEIDLAGGSYDNEISGLWNEAIPEIVDYYANKKHVGFESVYANSQ